MLLTTLKAETNLKEDTELRNTGWTGEFISLVFSVWHNSLYQQHKPGIPEATLISCHRFLRKTSTDWDGSFRTRTMAGYEGGKAGVGTFDLYWCICRDSACMDKGIWVSSQWMNLTNLIKCTQDFGIMKARKNVTRWVQFKQHLLSANFKYYAEWKRITKIIIINICITFQVQRTFTYTLLLTFMSKAGSKLKIRIVLITTILTLQIGKEIRKNNIWPRITQLQSGIESGFSNFKLLVTFMDSFCHHHINLAKHSSSHSQPY